ncbi:MAG: filamentous hemagglutinin N-terminal domain-containing protein, partial [Nitrospirota bacterium]
MKDHISMAMKFSIKGNLTLRNKNPFLMKSFHTIMMFFESWHYEVKNNRKERMRVVPFRDFFLSMGFFGRAVTWPQIKKISQLIFPFSRANTSFLFCLPKLPSVLVLSSVFLLALFSSMVLAQVITNITPDGSLGTKVPPGCAMCDITGGTRPGNGTNLFHSFQEFNVGPSGVANFLNDTGLPTSNILSRVTGGNPSNILGRIQTDGFGNANLFLMNPHGIVFGQDASLNVGGAASFTTADYLRLADGVQFTSMPSAQDALLSIAPVADFGFLGANPGGGISVQGSTLSVGEVGKGETLSLIGGNIEISGAKLKAPDGQMHLVSVTSPGTVSLGEGGDIQVNAAQWGQIGLSNKASVSVDGEVGGQVIIRSGQLTLDNSVISANTLGSPGAGAQIVGVPPKAGIRIQVTNDMLLDNLSSIETNVFDGSNHGGDIVLNVGGNLELRGGNIDGKNPFGSFSGIKTFAFGGSGNAGNISVNADKVIVNGEWLGMFSASFSKGNTGNIRLRANSLEMVGKDPTADRPPPFITTLTFGDGQGGDVDINIGSGNIFLDNGSISASTIGSGSGGNVKVEAKNLQMINGSIVQTGTFSLGNAGKTSIFLSENLDIRSGSFIGSLVDVSCMEPCGAAGNLKVEARDITIQGVQNAINPLSSPEFTGIRTRSVAESGGTVDIFGKNLHISDNGVIRSASIGSERAGNISINLKENLELDNKGQLLATAEGSGNAGDITVLAKNINLSRDSSVKAESTSTGNAGSIQLKADDTILIKRSTVTTKAENALGGNIKLTA